MFTWVVFDTSSIHTPPSIFSLGLPFALLLFNIFFIWGYIVYPNPVFHQITWGALLLATSGKGVWLLFNSLRETPEELKLNAEIRSVQARGTASFLFAFFVWNIDNLFCRHLTHLKHFVGPYLALFFELHAWWHIFVGLGVFLIMQGLSFLTLAIRDDPSHYVLGE
ncbi:hypothetical protein MNV49_004198 [Pseudohyphozyma bogoriensis]|nr:hypothetical protein MNV49_004198 [Pseudohyphozyma bogoriensis]